MPKLSVIWEFKFQNWQKSPATKQADWTHRARGGADYALQITNPLRIFRPSFGPKCPAESRRHESVFLLQKNSWNCEAQIFADL